MYVCVFVFSVFVFSPSLVSVCIPGNSAGALFGMVSSRDPFKGDDSDLQRTGIKRSRLESPGSQYICFFEGSNPIRKE